MLFQQGNDQIIGESGGIGKVVAGPFQMGVDDPAGLTDFQFQRLDMRFGVVFGLEAR